MLRRILDDQSGEPNLTDKAYATIKSRLIHLDLPPGATFTEASLASDLGISKTPVREALARVRREGLVEATARSGYHVTPVTLKDARDLLALRALLEGEAVSLAAKHMPDPKDLIALDRLCRSSYNPRDVRSIKTYMRRNTEFHMTIARASGNTHLAAILEDLLDHVERLYTIALTLTYKHEEIVHDHAELVRAIVSGNEKIAREVAMRDMLTSHRQVLDALVTSPTLLSANVVSIVPAAAPRNAAKRSVGRRHGAKRVKS